MALEAGADICSYFDRLESQRRNYENVLQDISDHVRGARDFNTTQTPGRQRHAMLYDTTSLLSGDMLASGLNNFLTNNATPWFGLQPQDPNMLDFDEVGLWFAEVERIMRQTFARSEANFTPTMHEIYLDLVFFGTACMMVEDVPGVGPRFKAIPLPQVYVAEGQGGQIDTVFRKFKLTHRQAVEKFGRENVGKAAELVEKRPEEEYEYLHFVHPRFDPARGRQSGEGAMPWRSVYIQLIEKRIVSEGGFRELPILVSRWEKEAGETYGRGPGWTALPEQKMLNKMSKTLIKAAEKVVDPPLQVADDGVILPLRTMAGGVNVVRTSSFNQDPVRPFPVQGNLPLGIEYFEERKKQVRGAFMHDLLQIFQQNLQTATQVLEISERAQALLSPVVGRLQIEILEPMIERVFGILLRSQALPPPPQDIAGTNINVEYVSPIQRSQKLGETRALVDTIGIISNMGQVEPSVLDILDWDEAARTAVENSQAPLKILRSAEEVERTRAAQRELAAQQAQQEEMMQGSEIIKNVAPAMQQGPVQ